MWSEMNEGEPIGSAAVAGVRKHVGNVASVGGAGSAAPCLLSSWTACRRAGAAGAPCTLQTEGTQNFTTEQAFYAGSSMGNSHKSWLLPIEGPESRRRRVREIYVPSLATGLPQDPKL